MTQKGTLARSSGRVWTCNVCRKMDVWGDTWSWFGSLKDLDNGVAGTDAAPTVCSDECKAKLRYHEDRKENARRNSRPLRTPAPPKPSIIVTKKERVGWCGLIR